MSEKTHYSKGMDLPEMRRRLAEMNEANDESLHTSFAAPPIVSTDRMLWRWPFGRSARRGAVRRLAHGPSARRDAAMPAPLSRTTHQPT